jgi:hypothetical protein
VELKWVGIDPTSAGSQQRYFTTALEAAVLVSMKEWFPITADQTKNDFSHFEDRCFTYRKIISTWEDGGVQTENDWKFGGSPLPRAASAASSCNAAPAGRSPPRRAASLALGAGVA